MSVLWLQNLFLPLSPNYHLAVLLRWVSHSDVFLYASLLDHDDVLPDGFRTE
jgi:hypothetical protein